MYEKVNPAHPDKIADRIAGAVVDLAYGIEKDPKIAVEVLIGHGVCTIITESSVDVPAEDVGKAVARIAGNDIRVVYMPSKQDEHLAGNQDGMIRCGDNGIFKGVPRTREQKIMASLARDLYYRFPTDGKYILDNDNLIVCQSNAEKEDILNTIPITMRGKAKVNPLGYWTGGTNVDTGATNRKLGSDMADSVTGGGIHGKDLSKADVSINIYAYKMANKLQKPVEYCCAIGDEYVDGKPYNEIVEIAREFIDTLGGFEALAEWGFL